ncbi:transmembrane protein 47-like [Clavelina lepadiformis]|uniref:transmembrane protein 47-like n=1 Tax=Clavelina lepadiformis TaxID=159417 RepID=UPI0040425970
MAKEVIVDISWLRPLKLIGLANLLCGIIAFILSMALEDWVISDEHEEFKYYMSLWKKCQKGGEKDDQTGDVAVTTPADQHEDTWTCTGATENAGYMSVVQAFIVIPFIIAILAFVIGCIAYCKREWRRLYRIAGIILIVAAVLVLLAVIIFPCMFLQELPFYAFFWFGWGYGIAWAAMCFILTAAVLFLISQDKKEIYHTQKTMNI